MWRRVSIKKLVEKRGAASWQLSERLTLGALFLALSRPRDSGKSVNTVIERW